MYLSICLLLGKFVRVISPGYKYKPRPLYQKHLTSIKQIQYLYFFGFDHLLGVGVEYISTSSSSKQGCIGRPDIWLVCEYLSQLILLLARLQQTTDLLRVTV
jgi:hypothetical protein